MTIEQDTIDARRYRWLRDNPRKSYGKQRSYDSPYVVNPRASRMYAIQEYKGNSLDDAIDEDILNDTAQHIYERTVAEGGDERFSDPNFKFSDEFADECMERAKVVLDYP
jgi:hypothetical protein